MTAGAEAFHYVIVGAGSAGCVLANRLTADGRHRVLLLEAGPRDTNPWIHIPLGYGKTMFDARINWKFESEPVPGLGGRRIKQPRGRVLGGSSSINGLLYVRGQREDFDGWAASGNPGWSYEDVLPYFRRSEDQVRGEDHWHATGGELGVSDLDAPHPIAEAFIAAAVHQGIPRNDDFNGERQEGVGYFQATARKGLRCSTAVGFLRPARARANLVIRTEARAERIAFEGGRASGVVYRHGGATRTALARREVLLAAGTIQSPQLLELSGVGDARRLQPLGIPVVRDLPGVGENLHDHLQARLIYRTREKITVNDDLQSLPRKISMVWRFAFGRRGPLGWLAGIAGGFAKTSPDLPRPDMQFHLYPYSSERVDPALHPFSAFTLTVCKLRPSSRGSCHIVSADPTVPPAIQPNYLGAPEDLGTMIAAVRIGRRVASDPALATLISVEYDPGPACTSEAQIEAFVRAKGFSVYHPVGTCAMGPGGVVDASLRVRGVEALRVIDASIMPSIVSGNTNAAAIMIGEKGADLVLRDAG